MTTTLQMKNQASQGVSYLLFVVLVFETREGEQIFAEKVTADCWKTPKMLSSKQVSGKAYFTDQRIAFFASGLIGTKSASWEINMADIAQVKPCMISMFFPFGIMIILKNNDKYKLSIMKRNKYIDWILQHIS